MLTALARILRLPIAATCAGRTDAGVHALGQVIHFDTDADVEPGRLLRGLNAVLPQDIRCRSAELAPPGFDARFSALWRRYQYRLTDTVPDPLTRNRVWAVPGPVDVALMKEAVAPLIGLHDFGSYCRPRPGATTIRGLAGCGWTRHDGEVWLDITADAFCHSMVRSIVGASVEVGRGRRPAAWLAQLLASPSREQAAPLAPPHGLVLQEVGYPPDDLLAAQVATARRRRV